MVPSAAADLPEPPVPAGTDLRAYAFTPIYRARLFGSAFHARATDAEWRAGVTLWLKSQDQVPAGSLPDDDIELCRLAEFGRDMRTWRKVKAMALHGWYRCSDGRLYNSVVAEIVTEQSARMVAEQERRRAWREKKAKQRGDGQGTGDENSGDSDGDETGSSPGQTGNVPGDNALKGQGQGHRREEKNIRPPPVQDAGPGGGGGEEGPVEAMIGAVDDAIAEHFGQRRRRRHPQDRAVARGWIEQGLSAATVSGIVEPIVGKRAANGQDAPESLKFFIDAVVRALASGAVLRERMAPSSAASDPALAEASRRYTDAVTAWSRDGRQGPSPAREQFGLPPLDA